jgi:hypothetical protein
MHSVFINYTFNLLDEIMRGEWGVDFTEGALRRNRDLSEGI